MIGETRATVLLFSRATPESPCHLRGCRPFWRRSSLIPLMARGASFKNLINCDGEHCKRLRRDLGVERTGIEDIERLCQKCREVVVIRAYHDPSSSGSAMSHNALGT